MNDFFKRFTSVLDTPLTLASRAFVFMAALALIPTFMVPLWHMTFVAQQYPEGLNLYVYSHDLVGGDNGQIATAIQGDRP